MRRWKFNYRLFFKKNMTGLLIFVLFGISAAEWDRGLILKTIALAEVMPKGVISLNIVNEENKIEITTQTKNGVMLENKKPDRSELFALSDEEKISYSDINYLKNKFYIVDSRTDISENDINAENFLERDFSLKEGDGPKILIFHTHSHECFADSNPSLGKADGILKAGAYLKELMETKYGIETMHCTESFDYVDSKMKIIGSYERMEPVIEKILKENPSIEVCIDMHRDGIADETKKLVTEVNGKPTAQVMFFNGLCRVYENGNLVPTAGLENPYLEDNLAFSFNMKVAADRLYPGFARRNYMNAYRYSLNMLPKSLLVEVGAQTNTVEEAVNAMEPLAEVLNAVLNK